LKAVRHTRYGPVDLLEFKEVDKPAPKDNEILIAIHATTVSTGDCNMRNFTFVTKGMLPFAKLAFGIGKPWKARVLGTELADEVVDQPSGLAGRRVVRPALRANVDECALSLRPEGHASLSDRAGRRWLGDLLGAGMTHALYIGMSPINSSIHGIP
jgi:NADPH:quinone reductase-like Zn-dependent oxidoreductase